MSSGYLYGNAQVLLSNGMYKCISSIQKGDTVLNMLLESVKVTNIYRGPPIQMIGIKYRNWYEPLYCSKDFNCLTLDMHQQNSVPTWISAQDLSTNLIITSDHNIYRELLPTDFNVNIELIPTVDLGFIFGLYAGFGSIIDNTVVFHVGQNSELIDKLVLLLKTVFNASSYIEEEDNCYKIYSKSQPLLDLFANFGSKATRCIPQEFWCSNAEFAQGIYDGLVASYDDYSIYIPVSQSMAQAFVWICSILEIYFEHNSQYVKDMCVNAYPLYPTNIKTQCVSFDTELMLDSWGIEIDCPSNSIIVNNIIVQSKC